MVLFQFLGNRHKIIRGVDLIAKGAPGFFFKKQIQIANGVRCDPQLDDVTKRHCHHPGDQLGTLGGEIAIQAGLLRISQDFINAL